MPTISAASCAQAEALYRQILADNPDHADAWHLLGLAAHQAGRHAEAADCIGRAVAINSVTAAYHNHLGAVHAALKQYNQAETCFRRAVELADQDAQAHYNLAALLNLTGRTEQAIAGYRRAVELHPQFSEAQFNLGNLLRDAGNLAEAEACYLAAVTVRPNYVKALVNLGATQTMLGRLDETEPLWRRVVELDPRHLEGWYRLGSVLQAKKQLPEAIQALQTAVLIDPHHVAAQNNLGCCYRELGQLDQAEQCFRLALAARADFAEGMINLASVLHEKKEDDTAAAYCRQALAIDPDAAAGHTNLASVLYAQKDYAGALEHYQRAHELEPESAEALANLGPSLQMMGRVDEAIDSYRRAIALDPKLLRARYCLGGALHFQGRIAEALSEHNAALAIDPECAEARYYRSFVHLSEGELPAGWQDYEARLRCKEYKPRNFAAPRWDGSPLAGRTLLVHAEQGLGDTLHFIRYVHLLRNLGGTVLVEVQPALVPLLKASGYTGVLAGGTPLPHYDVQVPLISLPGILGTRLETIPATVPYLAADARLIKHWRGVLRRVDGLKVGIIWQGNPAYMFDRLRSVPLVEFAPLAAVPGVRLIGLQKGTGSEQLAALDGRFEVLDLAGSLDVESGPFMDTAAVMCNLDLIVTSDTAAAHLAGGLGLRTWLATSATPEWRWMRDRQDSPWYPTMKLFRQATPGDWSGVFAAMQSELAATGTSRQTLAIHSTRERANRATVSGVQPAQAVPPWTDALQHERFLHRPVARPVRRVFRRRGRALSTGGQAGQHRDRSRRQYRRAHRGAGPVGRPGRHGAGLRAATDRLPDPLRQHRAQQHSQRDVPAARGWRRTGRAPRAHSRLFARMQFWRAVARRVRRRRARADCDPRQLQPGKLPLHQVRRRGHGGASAARRRKSDQPLQAGALRRERQAGEVRQSDSLHRFHRISNVLAPAVLL